MRILTILLLVLNAFAFAAIQGWLGDIGSARQRGDGARMADTLKPELIRLERETANR